LPSLDKLIGATVWNFIFANCIDIISIFKILPPFLVCINQPISSTICYFVDPTDFVVFQASINDLMRHIRVVRICQGLEDRGIGVKNLLYCLTHRQLLH